MPALSREHKQLADAWRALAVQASREETEGCASAGGVIYEPIGIRLADAALDITIDLAISPWAPLQASMN